MDHCRHRYRVRPAAEADLAALTEIKPPAGLHKDRLRDADGLGLLYLVVEEGTRIVGFGLLVFAWPVAWPPIDQPDARITGAALQEWARLPVWVPVTAGRRLDPVGQEIVASIGGMLRT
ncbi:MAG: hypothetical protein AB1505_19560 [Candidatus Latescibacterota bacterium]